MVAIVAVTATGSRFCRRHIHLSRRSVIIVFKVGKALVPDIYWQRHRRASFGARYSVVKVYFMPLNNSAAGLTISIRVALKLVYRIARETPYACLPVTRHSVLFFYIVSRGLERL